VIHRHIASPVVPFRGMAVAFVMLEPDEGAMGYGLSDV
jgi:hypothetical protein